MSVPQAGSFRLAHPQVAPANLWRFGPHGWPFYTYLTATANWRTGEGRVSLQEFRAGYPISESTMGRVRAHLEEIGEVEFMDVRKGFDKTVCVEFRIVHYTSHHIEKAGREATDWAQRYAAYREKAGKRKGGENHFTSPVTGDTQDLPSPVTGDTPHLPAPVTAGAPDLPSPVTTITPRVTTPRDDTTKAPRRARRVSAPEASNPLFPTAEEETRPAVSPEEQAANALHTILIEQAGGRWPGWQGRIRKAVLETTVRQWVEDGVTPERLREVIADRTVQTFAGALRLLSLFPLGRPGAGRGGRPLPATQNVPTAATLEEQIAIWGDPKEALAQAQARAARRLAEREAAGVSSAPTRPRIPTGRGA